MVKMIIYILVTISSYFQFIGSNLHCYCYSRYNNTYKLYVESIFSLPKNFIWNFIGDNFNQTKSPLKNASPRRNNFSIHLILLILFGSLFLFLFITVMAAFIYGLINKQYNRWIRKRSSRPRRKGRKIRNVVRDESTVLGLENDTV
jgi:hypothetical protein